MNDRVDCAEARRLQQIDAAFQTGDLEALRTAVGEPSAIPNGRMPDQIGSCLVYAIYHSPRPFIRTLLQAGADPNASGNDGFPPLIAALACGRDVPGAKRRDDVDEVLRLLLKFGADPNERGVNDYTPLHMAVAERNALAVQILLDAGANPELKTRIDEYETPFEMARAAGLDEVAAILERKGRPVRRRLRSGLTLLWDVAGTGEPVRRQHVYRLRLRLWLHRGEPVRWQHASGFIDTAQLDDDGETLLTDVRVDRRSLMAGLFYGVDGMRVGGTRMLDIAPHLGYGETGLPGLVPPQALLTAEVAVLGSRPWPPRSGS